MHSTESYKINFYSKVEAAIHNELFDRNRSVIKMSLIDIPFIITHESPSVPSRNSAGKPYKCRDIFPYSRMDMCTTSV